MNIGFDIDGTLTDFYGFVKNRGPAYLEKHGVAHTINPHGYDLDEYFSLSEALQNGGMDSRPAREESERHLSRFWDRVYLAYLYAPFHAGMPQAIRRLKQEGHRIFIISSRKGATTPTVKGRFIKHSIRWQLRLNKVPYDGLLLLEDDDKKLQAIKDSKIDLFVEDKPHLIATLAHFTRCVAISTPYNSPLEPHDNLMVCEQPGRVYEAITELLKRPISRPEGSSFKM